MKKFTLIFLILLLLLSFALRYSGIKINHPFWIDEFNSAIQANVIRDFVSNRDWLNFTTRIERNNFLTHSLIALSFAIFGESESVARLPFVIIGSTIPVLMFIFSRKYFSMSTGLVSSLFLTFSYFQITWSDQARGYVLQQFLSLVAVYLYLKLFEESKQKLVMSSAFLFCLSLGAGLATHNMFLLLPFSVFVHCLIYYKERLRSVLLNPIPIALLILATLLALKIGVYRIIFNTDLFHLFNNLWYYHSLLWREYGLMTFLALIGAFIGLKRNRKAAVLIIIFCSFQLIFVTFFFGHYMSKYIFPIFHWIILFSSLGIVFIANNIAQILKKQNFAAWIAILLTLFIIVNGDKFVIKPKSFYSVNHDMRDIALVDYHKVYQRIEENTKNVSGFAIIETWPDRARWYFRNNDKPEIYWFRWIDGGFRKKTNYYVNDHGEKIVNGANVKFVGELGDLQQIIDKYPHGFIWIDDATLPVDIVGYVRANFKEELTIDHYILDDNPYSIWPGTLYSWGFS